MTTVIQWNPQYDTAVSQFREPGLDIPCLMPWRFLFIQEHTKKVFGCPYHTIPYGDLSTTSLDEIWNAEPVQQMRRSLLDRQIPRFCLNHSAACPIIMDAQASGFAPPAEFEIVVGGNDYWFMGQGWFGVELIPEPIRWMSSNADFRIRSTGRFALRIELMTLRLGLDEAPLTGTLWTADRQLGRFALDTPDWRSLIFPLSPEDRSEDLCVRIVVDETWTPPPEAEFGDSRKLGVAVRRIATF